MFVLNSKFNRDSTSEKLDSRWKKSQRKTIRMVKKRKKKRWKNCIQSNCIGGKWIQNNCWHWSFDCFISMFASLFHRDTPHHLKNKRVQHGAIDKTVANILLANAPKQLETLPPSAINNNNNDNIIPTDSNHENKPGHLNDCGKFAHNFHTQIFLYVYIQLTQNIQMTMWRWVS